MTEQFTQRQQAVAQALCQALENHRPGRERLEQVRPAAVLMPLWDDGKRVQVVFTKRTETLPSHAGQISFPGGMVDPEDPDHKTTALRETHEEVGVPPQEVELITRLDQVVTVTGYLVTPYLGEGKLPDRGHDLGGHAPQADRLVPGSGHDLGGHHAHPA
jgi:8-oxo-dGTP pyrophosphatase MutT (NUDIX family)